MTDTPLLRSLLRPFAALYGLGVALRNTCYDRSLLKSNQIHLPILCVGNAVVGGSGKTPFTSYLARSLKEQGHTPVILLRGYGGVERGPLQVDRGCAAADVGEEALLHLELLDYQTPVVIAADRSAGARFILENKLGDVIVLDDGFQHRRLERDLNILLLDLSSQHAMDKWNSGALLPAGFLREPLSSALARADRVVFVRKTSGTMSQADPLESVSSLPQEVPTHSFELKPSTLVDLNSNERIEATHFLKKNVTALTAIAGPDSFHAMLSALGFSISTQSKSYRDHHHFTLENWNQARSVQLPIITTSKDAIKLRHFVTEPGQAFALELSGSFSSESDATAFWQAVQNVVSGAGRKFG